MGKVGANRVHAAPPGGFGRHIQPVPAQKPAPGGGQGQGEARLIHMAEVDQPVVGYFSSAASAVWRVATSSAFYLWVSDRVVR